MTSVDIIKEKYGIVRNCNLIFRFNKYSKKLYYKIIKRRYTCFLRRK